MGESCGAKKGLALEAEAPSPGWFEVTAFLIGSAPPRRQPVPLLAGAGSRWHQESSEPHVDLRG